MLGWHGAEQSVWGESWPATMFQRAAYIAKFKFNLKHAVKKTKEDSEVGPGALVMIE